MIEFKKLTDFPRGTIYNLLSDAYSYDPRNREIWDDNWRETDRFFYDNPEIASKYGLVTCLDGEPIGFVVWDPRNRPDYVEIGHNGIREKHKRKGFNNSYNNRNRNEYRDRGYQSGKNGNYVNRGKSIRTK